jgi:hypothetical protein
MGGMTMGECKDRQRKFRIIKQIINIPKEDMEDYHWAMFIHAMDFFKERTSLKKLILEHFFKKIFNYLLTKDLLTFVKEISINFIKIQKHLCNSKQTNLGATKNKKA